MSLAGVLDIPQPAEIIQYPPVAFYHPLYAIYFSNQNYFVPVSGGQTLNNGIKFNNLLSILSFVLNILMRSD